MLSKSTVPVCGSGLHDLVAVFQLRQVSYSFVSLYNLVNGHTSGTASTTLANNGLNELNVR